MMPHFLPLLANVLSYGRHKFSNCNTMSISTFRRLCSIFPISLVSTSLIRTYLQSCQAIRTFSSSKSSFPVDGSVDGTNDDRSDSSDDVSMQESGNTPVDGSRLNRVSKNELTTSHDDEQRKDIKGDVYQNVLSDLAQLGKVRRESLEVMEKAPEWQDYESHVNFELNMLRMRYVSTENEPMTPARRAQMQAHLKAKQQEIMELHAEEAAKSFVESLSSNEMKLLRQMISRLDPEIKLGVEALGPSGDAHVIQSQLQVSSEKVKNALWEVSSALSNSSNKSK